MSVEAITRAVTPTQIGVIVCAIFLISIAMIVWSLVRTVSNSSKVLNDEDDEEFNGKDENY